MLFKTDENLPLAVRDSLRAAGHDASSVVDQGMVGRLDSEIASVCRAEGRAIVTLDKDFADIRTFPPQDYAGIIVIRSALQSKAAVLRVFKPVLQLLAVEPLAGHLWIVDETNVRIRHGESS